MKQQANSQTITEEQIAEVAAYFESLQQEYCQHIASLESCKDFMKDEWSYENGQGGGVACVLQAGDVIEQGGVNFSKISGDVLPKAATAKRSQLATASFTAMGVSTVMHPCNPLCPTSHANLRLMVAHPKANESLPAQWWFGGGFDLTPYYGFKEDATLWHQHARDACVDYQTDAYPRFKKQCDDYFYLPHREEARGIGGLFFDDLTEGGFDACFSFIKQVAQHYLMAYMTILTRRKDMPYDDLQRFFQCYRRGRYAEFNLLYDRGTLFGLQSGGRAESILMSLPPTVHWRYGYCPEWGTRERELYEDFLPVRDWLLDDDK